MRISREHASAVAFGIIALALLALCAPSDAQAFRPTNADTAFRQIPLATPSGGHGYVPNAGHTKWPAFLDDSTLVRAIGRGDSILIASFRTTGVSINLDGAITFTLPANTYANRVGTIVTANDWIHAVDGTLPILTASFTFGDGRHWGVGTSSDVMQNQGKAINLVYQVRNWSNQVAPTRPDFVMPPRDTSVFQLCAHLGTSGIDSVFSDLQTFKIPDTLRNAALSSMTFSSYSVVGGFPFTSTTGLISGIVVWPQFRTANRMGDSIAVLRQDNAAWADSAYGGYYNNGSLVGQERTIGDLGCGISCIAMLHNYFHVRCRPDTLNHWLQTHQGYSVFGGVDIESVGTVAPGNVVTFRWHGDLWPAGQTFVVEADTDFVPVATIRIVNRDAIGGRAEFVQVFGTVGSATVSGRQGVVRSDANPDLAARAFSQGRWSLVGAASGSPVASQVEKSLGDSLPVMLQVNNMVHVVLADGRKPVWESDSVARGTYAIADPLGDSRDLYHTYSNTFSGIARPVRSPQYPSPMPSRAMQVGAERGLSLIVDGPSTVYIQAPSGGTITYDATLGTYVSSIPGAIALRAVRSVPRAAPESGSPLHDAFYLPEADAGGYSVWVSGLAAGRSGLSVEAYDLGGTPTNAFASADYSSGQTALFHVNRTQGGPITLGLLGFTGVKQTPRLASVSAAPSPAIGQIRVSWQLLRDATGSVTVCDVAGRRVAVLARGRLGAGAHSVSWSGVDQHGMGVRPGVYFVRVVADDFVSTARFVLLGGS